MIKTIKETVQFDLYVPSDVDKYYRELACHLNWDKDISWKNNNVIAITFTKEDDQND